MDPEMRSANTSLRRFGANFDIIKTKMQEKIPHKRILCCKKLKNYQICAIITGQRL